jgi:FkbM family methyltransferase
MSDKVDLMKRRMPSVKIYNAVISDIDDEEVIFHITNNGQSSSIFEFGTHSINHPSVIVKESIKLITTRMDTLISRESIDMSTINFINLDIQGAELKALQSMESHLDKIQYIYTEVNTEEVYKGCCKIGELDEFLSNYGFKRVATKMTNAGWGDAFYMKL